MQMTTFLKNYSFSGSCSWKGRMTATVEYGAEACGDKRRHRAAHGSPCGLRCGPSCSMLLAGSRLLTAMPQHRFVQMIVDSTRDGSAYMLVHVMRPQNFPRLACRSVLKWSQPFHEDLDAWRSRRYRHPLIAKTTRARAASHLATRQIFFNAMCV